MSAGDGAGSERPRVTRVDDRLGLAIVRAGLSGRTLVTYARDHVLVRTPSRPGFAAGNSLDLLAPPAAEALAGWIERFRETVGRVGVEAVQLRWEAPAAPEEGPGPEVASAAEALGLTLRPARTLLLDAPAAEPATAAELVPVAPPTGAPGGPTDRRWHGARVLYRYDAEEPGPEGWRDLDEQRVDWRIEVQRELAAEGRARAWLAVRHGAPVGRITVVHDRQGLAALQDLVVHPVHRNGGVGAALADAAVRERLAAAPGTRVGAAVAPGSPAERLARRLGFAPHTTVWVLASPGGRPDAGWR